MRVFSAHVAHDLDAKTFKLSKKMVQGRRRLIQVNFPFLSVFRGQIGKQLPVVVTTHISYDGVLAVVGVYPSKDTLCRTLNLKWGRAFALAGVYSTCNSGLVFSGSQLT